MKLSVSIIILLLSGIAFGQNMVKNGDFEDFKECPENITTSKLETGLEVIPNWVKPTDGTPDYYNSCAKSFKSRTGPNWIGSIEPQSGAGFMGFLLHDEVNEYIQTELTEPLERGVTYTLTFYVAHADKSRFITDQVGGYFTKEKIQKENYKNIYVNPQVRSKSLNYLESGKWIEVKGTFMAEGGEKFLTLGGFNAAPNSREQTANKKGKEKKDLEAKIKENFCYYYIDNVSLTKGTNSFAQISKLNSAFFTDTDKDNLVVNGSFEFSNWLPQHKTSFKTQMNSPVTFGWIMPTGVPADYHNYKSVQGQKVNREYYKYFYQTARSGDACAGITGYHELNDTILKAYSSYIQAEFREPLIAGKVYEISFYAHAGPFSQYSTDDIGAYVSKKEVKQDDRTQIAFEPTVNHKLGEEISYLVGWKKISGMVTAKGGEKYITIGNFNYNAETIEGPNNGTGEFQVKSRKIMEPVAYYYIDDVSVVEEGKTCFSKFTDGFAHNNMVFVFDAKSKEGTKFIEVVDYMHWLSRAMREVDNMGILSQKDEVNYLMEEVSIKRFNQIEKAIKQMKVGGNCSDAVIESFSLIEEKKEFNTNNHVFLVTDGTTQLTKEAIEAIENARLKSMYITIISINGKHTTGLPDNVQVINISEDGWKEEIQDILTERIN